MCVWGGGGGGWVGWVGVCANREINLLIIILFKFIMLLSQH